MDAIPLRLKDWLPALILYYLCTVFGVLFLFEAGDLLVVRSCRLDKLKRHNGYFARLLILAWRIGAFSLGHDYDLFSFHFYILHAIHGWKRCFALCFVLSN